VVEGWRSEDHGKTWFATNRARYSRTGGSVDLPALAAHGYLAFSVVDIDAGVKWYREKLGLRTLFYAPRTEAVHASAAFLQGGELFVELVQVDGAADLSRYLPPRQIAEGAGRQYIHGLFKAGAVVDDFNQAVATLRARGVAIVDGPRPTKSGQPANVTIRDYEGNRIPLLDASFSASPTR
jgi:catechol 2,3-dioxygenase-like lactoylglutathione lyase family enzyme